LATTENPALPTGLHSDATLELPPLDPDGVRAVAQLYAGGRDDVNVAVEHLAEVSGGVPQRVHRAASEWARAEASRRRGAAADRAAGERKGLRVAEDDLASDVVELQAIRQRAELEDAEGVVVACPFKGLASFDVEDAEVFFGRERLVAEMVARLAGAPLMGIVGPSGSGKSSALRAGLLAAVAGGVLPGSERWTLAVLRPGEHPLRALEQATADAAPPDRLSISSRRRSRPAATSPSAGRSSTPSSAVLATRADGHPCSWPCAPTSTGAVPRIPSCRACSAPTTSWSGRCAAPSCAARSSCPRAAPASMSSRSSSMRWSPTSKANLGHCRCCPHRCWSCGSVAMAGACG
jgi:hypothetical protein